jgi:hypothetical protein
MEHSQYRHFPSRAREGAEVMVLHVGDIDRIGCFADQVKLTRALVRDLSKAVKEVKLLGKHGEEANWKITELEVLGKKYAEDAQKPREEKATLEGTVESHEELIKEITDEIELNPMGEDADDEDEDDDDGRDATAPLLLCHTLFLCYLLLPHLRRSSWKKVPWRWFLSKRPLK